MKRIESIEDELRGVVTYRLPNGQNACFDARAVKEYGIAALMSGSGLGEFIPTERVAVMQHGRRIGTLPTDFDPSNIRSGSFFYDPRPGDFKRDGDVWIAANNLGGGDLNAISGFVRG